MTTDRPPRSPRQLQRQRIGQFRAALKAAALRYVASRDDGAGNALEAAALAFARAFDEVVP